MGRILTLVRRAADASSTEPLARKSKREVVEQLQLWAALESMAVRLAASSASDAAIAGLRHILDELWDSPPSDSLDEYAAIDTRFHSTLIALSGSKSIEESTRWLLALRRAISRATATHRDQAVRARVQYLKLIEALENRDAEMAERLSREHTLGLAGHVERHWSFLRQRIG
ncbi:MAG: FCD domain-containing protein [Steroidobacteraceae bacterium]